MHRDIARLIMYGDLDHNTVLYEMGEVFRAFEEKQIPDAELIRRIYQTVKHLLIVATDYGFDKNLWHNYLVYFLITNENPFSLTCEKVGANDGSVNFFAKNDFQVIKNLFDYDFSTIEAALGIDCFSRISSYQAIAKKDLMYNHKHCHPYADPFMQQISRDLIGHQAKEKDSHTDIHKFLFHFSPSIQDFRSSSDTFPLKRFPSSQVPLPARASMLGPLRPIPLLAEVQNGITVIPSKLYFSTKVSIIRGSSPHQIGNPR